MGLLLAVRVLKAAFCNHSWEESTWIIYVEMLDLIEGHFSLLLVNVGSFL